MERWTKMLAELASDRFLTLKRQAFLLCGDDARAENLVQDALVRAFSRPLRTPRPGNAEAYVRAIMVNLLSTEPGGKHAGTGQRQCWQVLEQSPIRLTTC